MRRTARPAAHRRWRRAGLTSSGSGFGVPSPLPPGSRKKASGAPVRISAAMSIASMTPLTALWHHRRLGLRPWPAGRRGGRLRESGAGHGRPARRRDDGCGGSHGGAWGEPSGNAPVR
jgi:hypothetical protein